VTYADAVTIVGVAWSGSSRDYQDFVERHGITFTTLDDSDGEIFQEFGVPGQPAWAFISQDGQEEVLLGGLTEEQFERKVQELSGSSS
jgi:hypothetical protein